MGKFQGVLLVSDFDNTLVYTEEVLLGGGSLPPLSRENRRALEYFTAQGGLFLWLTLPQSIPMRDFCTAAVRDHQVAVVPGTTFTVDPNSPIQGFRVNFSAPSYEALEEGFARLEACLRTFS